MSKYLDKVIKEMENYGNMGLPGGETTMGMGSAAPMGMQGCPKNKQKLKAYKLNDLLRARARAEEEEGFDDAGDDMSAMDNMDDMEGMDDMENGTEELKQFFMDNPEPADEEIAMYAEEHGMDLQDMRQAVYRLIQSLLPSDEEGIDDDEMDISIRGDTGERPASNEMGDEPKI